MILLFFHFFQGNFGCVYKGNLKGHSVPVAIKTCKETLSDDMKKKFLQEGRILKQYNHENIVRFIGIAATRQPVMIIMEYVPGELTVQKSHYPPGNHHASHFLKCPISRS